MKQVTLTVATFFLSMSMLFVAYSFFFKPEFMRKWAAMGRPPRERYPRWAEIVSGMFAFIFAAIALSIFIGSIISMIF